MKTFSQKILSSIRKHFLSKIYYDTNSDYRNSILLVSTGRSGSTFVSNVINYKNDHRIIFEPFKSDRVPAFKGLKYPTYVAQDDLFSKYRLSVEKILRGKLRNDWSDGHNKKHIASKRLIKTIRGNLMLKWIKNNFPELPVIFLIRNPFAVVDSWMRANWEDENVRTVILSQPELINDYLTPFIEDYKKASAGFELCFFNWCINYFIPLQQFKGEQFFITFYEHYILEPEEEAKRVFNYLGIADYDLKKILSIIKKPSRTTRKDSPLFNDKDILNHWKQRFTKEQIDRGYEILELFGLDKIYDKNSIPNKKIVI